MTIIDQMLLIVRTKDEIRRAVNSVGGFIPQNTPFDEYPALIRQIQREDGNGVWFGLKDSAIAAPIEFSSVKLQEAITIEAVLCASDNASIGYI